MMIENNYIAEIKSAIVHAHKCECSHTRTESVREVMGGRVVWEGAVEVFALLGHDEALRCYAWGRQRDEGGWEITTVLAIPPVLSAETAVKAAIIAAARRL